jgi:hypothetical protein
LPTFLVLRWLHLPQVWTLDSGIWTLDFELWALFLQTDRPGAILCTLLIVV